MPDGRSAPDRADGHGSVSHSRVAPRRGAARSRTWWGKAWVRAVEESAYSDTDLRTARSLARSGRIGSITVSPGRFVAAVESGSHVDTVQVSVAVLDAPGQDALVDVVAGGAGRVAALLAGDLPHGLVEECEEVGVELVPYGGELAASCTCSSWVDPCPHALAVGYQVAWLLDADPLVLIALRGLPREELLARLHARQQGADPVTEDEQVALDAALDASRLLAELDAPGGAPDREPRVPPGPSG